MSIYNALSIDNVSDTEIAGQLPQLALDHSPGKKLRFDYQSLHTMDPFEEPTVLPNYYFVPGAKWTDVMIGEWLRKQAGLFVSPKLKKILEKHSIGRHAFYQVPVMHSHPEDSDETNEESENEEVTHYFFLHLAFEQDENIDFEKSIIVNEIDEDETLGITSIADIESEKKKFKFPLWKKVSFKKPLALFRLYNSTDIYLSPALADELEKEKITGIKLAPEYDGLEVESP